MFVIVVPCILNVVHITCMFLSDSNYIHVRTYFMEFLYTCNIASLFCHNFISILYMYSFIPD